MTERLYYNDSFLYEFDARVSDVIAASPAEPRPAVVLDRSAFYPTSGGQVFDTGVLAPIGLVGQPSAPKVVEVSERDDGTVLHFVDQATPISMGVSVRGVINEERRRDHMQQHSGQHVLSAAFVRLFNMPTVSFHMGDDYCSIDLDTRSVTPQQVEAAEKLSNEVIGEDRQVQIRYVTQEEARTLGLRKAPVAERDRLRLIDIQEFDLSACGGTHVRGTGQIGSILLRKVEKVRQGVRVEFVCGMRAVKTARRDYTTLVDSAALFSSHMWDVPEQIRKVQDETKAGRRSREQLLGELAESNARQMLAETPAQDGRKIIVKVFADRDLAYMKLFAQKMTRLQPCVTLLASTAGQPAFVFAQSAGQPFDMGALLKQALAETGGRGGGSKDMAQGGPEKVESVLRVLEGLRQRLVGS
jgi:alanyl-tRNA synthetase